MAKIKLRRERRAAVEVVFFTGGIDEHISDAAAALERDAATDWIFNLKGIDYVNSAGIRSWITFIKDFGDGRKLRLEECSASIVEQMRMIRAFRCGLPIGSAYAAYFCAACGHAFEVLAEGDVAVTGAGVASAACPKCGNDAPSA